ncbi:unnamed protein product [Phytomonas sp. Hart1]|nr:unnamed protein product [Phytomonas sp. Hart1]|eukprot:CCW68462.1 unnamed protein product [Phytomonas sp. isolate Hart1]
MFLFLLLLGQLLEIGTIQLFGNIQKLEYRVIFFIVFMVDSMPIHFISLLVLKGIHVWQEWLFIHESEVPLPPLQEPDNVERHPQDLNTILFNEAMREEENLYAPMCFSAQYEKEHYPNSHIVEANPILEYKTLLKCIKKNLNNSMPVSFFERNLPHLALKYCKMTFFINLRITLVLLLFIKNNAFIFSLNQRLFDFLTHTTPGYSLSSTIARTGLGDVALFFRHALTVMPSFNDMINVRMNFLFFLNCPILVGYVVFKFMPSNRWKRNWTMFYILIRGLIVGFSLIFLSFMIMRIPGSFLESSFLVSKNAITGLMSPTTAWHVLQKNDLVPLVCDSTEHPIDNSFIILKALYTVSRDFIPSRADPLFDIQTGVCLNTFDAASCGSFLFHEKGYIHYAAYSARVVWRVLSSSAMKEFINTLLFTMIPVSALLSFDIVRNRTKLGHFLTEGTFFIISHLDAWTALRIFFELSTILMVALTIMSWSSWALLRYLSPGSFPVVIDYFSHNFFIIIRTWSKCPNLLRTFAVWRKISDVLQRLFGAKDAAIGTNRRSARLVPVGIFFNYLLYATTYFAISVVLTSLVRYIQLSSSHLWLIYVPFFDLFVNLFQLLNLWEVIHFLMDRVKECLTLYFAKLYLYGVYGLKLIDDRGILIFKMSTSIPSIFKQQVIETQKEKILEFYNDASLSTGHLFWISVLPGRNPPVAYSMFYKHLPLLYRSFSAKRRRVMYGNCIIHLLFWLVAPLIAGRGYAINDSLLWGGRHQTACLLSPWWYKFLRSWLAGIIFLSGYFIIEYELMETPFLWNLKNFYPHNLFYWHIDMVHRIAIPIIIRCVSMNLYIPIHKLILTIIGKTKVGKAFRPEYIPLWIIFYEYLRKKASRRHDTADNLHNVDVQAPTITQINIERPWPIGMDNFRTTVNQEYEKILPDSLEVVTLPFLSGTNFIERFRHFFTEIIPSIIRRMSEYLHARWVELVYKIKLYLYTAIKEDDTIGVVFQDYQQTF